MLERLKALMGASAVVRFLICGGTAAAINWLARIALSLVLPFELAIMVAYAIGMTAGFLLYRSLVWPGQHGSWRSQAPAFVVVNAAGAVIVLLTAIGLDHLGTALFGPSGVVEAVAHGLAIGVGAVANYLGHSRITFAVRA